MDEGDESGDEKLDGVNVCCPMKMFPERDSTRVPNVMAFFKVRFLALAFLPVQLEWTIGILVSQWPASARQGWLRRANGSDNSPGIDTLP